MGDHGSVDERLSAMDMLLHAAIIPQKADEFNSVQKIALRKGHRIWIPLVPALWMDRHEFACECNASA